MDHKAGFVNIVGNPNVGKSTLLNALVGERLAIVSPKVQTTRKRIMGIVNGEDYQIVYSDTPGWLDPKYKLQDKMVGFVQTALQDADVLLLVTDVFEKEEDQDPALLLKINQLKIPVLALINKIDLVQPDRVGEKMTLWEKLLPEANIHPVSALHDLYLEGLLEKVVGYLPNSPPYFSKDELTDQSMRFFVSEIVREKIFLNYKKEIPYSCEVVVQEYKEEEKIVRIRCEIFVMRDSQKAILIGKAGASLKKVGIESRKDLEAFIGRQVFLDLHVKVDKNWRDSSLKLNRFGYQ